MDTYFKQRGALPYTGKALKNKKLTIGFLGGSITEQAEENHWPEAVVNWFVEAYPAVRITSENAAIGATGSDLAAFRVERDILSRPCDLIFVEYAVNDLDLSTDARTQSREGLVRKLLRHAAADVVFVYTFSQPMTVYFAKGQLPPSIAEFEQLAEHYQISSVQMGLYAFDLVRRGRMRWEEWLPDGLHPHFRGSLSYGEAVIAFLKTALACPDTPAEARALPAPFHPGNWENCRLLPFDALTLRGPWKIQRSTNSVWADHYLETCSIDAELEFEFTGRACLVFFDFGRLAGDYQYKIDGGDWITDLRERPDWCRDFGWLRGTCLLHEEVAQRHHVVLRNVCAKSPDCRSTNFRLAYLGIV